MTAATVLTLAAATGFVSGSLPFGYLAGKIRGIDIRDHGSGNIGATNVSRVLGKGIGVPVFILDLLKGLLPCLFVRHWIGGLDHGPIITSIAVILTGLGAIFGHVFTPWLKFKGGKGVATAAGVLLGITPVAMAAALLVWLIFFFSTRYVSLASIAAAITVPLALAVQMQLTRQWDGPLLGFGILIGVLVVLRHRANIGRLIAGKEPKSGGRKTAPPAA